MQVYGLAMVVENTLAYQRPEMRQDKGYKPCLKEILVSAGDADTEYCRLTEGMQHMQGKPI